MRVLCGYLSDSRTGLMWRPRPENCEIRVFDGHQMVETYALEET